MREHGVEVSEDVCGGHPQLFDSMQPQQRVAPAVEGGLIAAVVRLAVDLDAEPGGGTEEVEREEAGGVLLTELEVAGTIAKGQPEAEFGG